MKAKRVALFGILTAVALVLGWVDRMIPIAPMLPGVKLGLSNVVLLFALYMMDFKSSIALLVLKVGLTGLLLTGNFSGFALGAAGGAASFIMMGLAKFALDRLCAWKGLEKTRAGRGIAAFFGIFGVIIVSTLGGFAHINGQMIAAYFLIYKNAVLALWPLYLLPGIGTGFLTGVVAMSTLRALHVIRVSPRALARSGEREVE